MTQLSRAQIAFYNDIRGGPWKSVGTALSKTFKKREPLDSSSGDLPACLKDGRYPSLDAAFAVSGDKGRTMAYNHPLYRPSQEMIWGYLTGLDPRVMENESARAHPIPGISGFMPHAIKASAHALGFSREQWHSKYPLFVIIPPIHPHWIAGIVENFGYDSIRTIKRTPDGLPDMQDAEAVFRKLDRPFIVILTPDENPSGVCTPNDMLVNDEQTGIMNRIKNNPHWGILLLDSIYMDLAWGENAGKRQELIARINDEGIRTIIMHSLSKVFMKPGARIGGMVYVGPLEGQTEQIGFRLLTRIKALVAGSIANGISAPTLKVLIEAYGNDPAIAREILRTKDEVQALVAKNEAIINGGMIAKAYPKASIDAAFYGFHKLTGDTELPWYDPEYRQWLIQKIESKLDLNDLDTKIAWVEFREVVGETSLTASQAFALELAMNGLMVLPQDTFFPMFKDEELEIPFEDKIMDGSGKQEAISFRTILAHSGEEVTKQTVGIIREVLEDRTADYKRNKTTGSWRNAYS